MRMKRALILLHKWLGIGLALFFLMWFASGIVLHFVPFPNLTQDERLRALPVLQAGPGCCLTADEAVRRAGLEFSEARLGMHGALTAWRLLGRPRGDAGPLHWHALDARTGAAVPRLSDAQAVMVAEAFSGRHALEVERLQRDQWTVPQGLDPYRPLAKVRLDGDDGLELYVSLDAAEVVRDTRRGERFWNWLGAVPHWIYPTLLRQFPRAWHHAVVWLSIPGTLLAASGLVLGIWQLFLNRSRWIPYRKPWMRWHHIAGLAASVFTLTWMFSGLLSMNPFGVFSSRSATAMERTLWLGAPAAARLDPASALASTMARADGPAPRELELLRVDGQAWYRLRNADRQWLVRADREANAAPPDSPSGPQMLAALPDATVIGTLRGLRPQAGAPQVLRISAYDDLYYASDPSDADSRYSRPLPAWRANWTDGTVVYADPASARIVLRVDGSGRWQRVLYNGLHRLDFAPLLARPWLRHVLVVGLSLLGLALCITSCVIAWRALHVAVQPRSRRQ